MDSYVLDRLDLEILRLLQKNARLTTKQLGYALKKGNTTVSRRMERLIELGYIDGVELLLNQNKLGRNLIAFTNLQLKDHSTGGLETFQREACRFEEVHECYHLTGNFDFMLKVVVADMAEYQKFLKEKLSRLENLGAVQSYLVIHEAKRKLGYPVRG